MPQEQDKEQVEEQGSDFKKSLQERGAGSDFWKWWDEDDRAGGSHHDNANGLLDIGCELAAAAVTVFGGNVDIGVVMLSRRGDSDALYSFSVVDCSQVIVVVDWDASPHLKVCDVELIV